MKAASGSVYVAGSINVDLIVGVSRLPAPGETVLGGELVRQYGGKSANQAMAARRVGAEVCMLGAVGADDFGRGALDNLGAAGVDNSRCRVLDDHPTGVALIVVDEAGENQIAVASGANASLDGAMIEAATADLAPPPGSVCLIGFEVGDAAILAAARWAAGHRLRVVVNPAPARPLPDELLASAPVLTPNRSEATLLTGHADPASAAADLAGRTGAAVVITLGADGALLWQEGHVEHLPAAPVVPVDTTGAGDALNGIFAAELARGLGTRDALRRAMVGAALKTTVAGAQAGLPSADAIDAQLALA